ncbi:Crp/Fnr family transcriptional regulator [Mesorhizobium sp. AaZ16]|uniref:Crp/Fnr family transcriptional regulator n=1 Tax=Mesorhizobium sp. AaZ16 TaxID=3402289 RepID=UPI00374EFD2B
MKLGVRPRNLLLSIIGAQDLALIKPHLERVSLQARAPVETVDAPVSYAYFPEDCLISVIARLRDDKAIEASVVGREGMTGTAILLNDDTALNDCRVQIAGAAWRIGSAALRSLLEKSPTLQAHLLRYIQVLLVQTSQTALANSHLTLEKRLARWLLMVHDRVGRDEFGLTHEFLAAMLGVRRTGVTVALHMLEGKHLIRSTRARIQIRDRAGLEALVSTSYGIPEAQYRRLFPEAGF